MTVVVKESSESVLSGLSKMKTAMIEDYTKFMPPTNEVRTMMNREYVDDVEIKYGKKYIKIINAASCMAFVVAVDNDVKFRKGDILKPAGYNAPARYAARGNILDGNYPINWTGPLYL